MSSSASAFQERLFPGEELLAVVEDLSFNVVIVPVPSADYPTGASGALALTNRRLIAVWAEGGGWRWFYIPALNGLSERPLRRDKPYWPHQAVLMVPGGIGLVVQTQTRNVEDAKRLSSLLIQALMTLSVRQVDDGAVAAIIDYKQEQERRRRELRED